jgi:hypothetical protein
MKNVEMAVEGNILTIKVDLTEEFGPSSSGKTIIIASTEGNVSVPGDEDKKVGLNVYRKKATWRETYSEPFRVELETRNRGKGADRWLIHLQGKKHIQVVDA